MEVRFHRNFEKKFSKLPPKIQQRFYNRSRIFFKNKSEKTLNNHEVDAAFPGCRSINITGDYRAIFHEQGGVATFITIGTHADLYG